MTHWSWKLREHPLGKAQGIDFRSTQPDATSWTLRKLKDEAGVKPRFKVLSPEGAQGNLAQSPGSRTWWANLVDPLEIKCVQGGSGGRGGGTEALVEIPLEACEEFYHGTYPRCLQSILMRGGLYPGGLGGASRRNRIHVSVANWTQYDENCEIEQKDYTAFRLEPYWPRSDWNVQVVLGRRSVRETCGPFYQGPILSIRVPCWYGGNRSPRILGVC